MTLRIISSCNALDRLAESVAERELGHILEGGPGTGTRAVFAQASDWRDAMDSLAKQPRILDRAGLVIFPQMRVCSFRVDFLIVASVGPDMHSPTERSSYAFIIECDGRAGHAETSKQVRVDLDRQRAIYLETGMVMLRFSGAEVMFQKRDVSNVIGACVEALGALRHAAGAVADEAAKLLVIVERLAEHRALRSDYTARNAARSEAEPYDQDDPFGFDLDFAALENEAAWDDLLRMRIQHAQLLHEIAHARRRMAGACPEEPDGDLRPFADIILAAPAAIRAVSRR